MQKEVKNILFVISSLTSGGAERVAVELANFYDSQGIHVTIILFSFDDVAYDVNPDVDLVFMCNQVKGKNRLLNVLKRFILIRGYFRKIKSDIILSFLTTVNMYACAAAWITGKKVIVSERNDPSRIFSAEWRHKVRDQIYKLADGYVFQTEEARTYFKGKIRDKAAVIPNPVRINLPEPYKGIRRNAIVACGRLVEQKNYPLLLQAFSNLDGPFEEYVLEIYGEGELLEPLRALSDTLGITTRVCFLGVRKDWLERARDASLYVMSSDYEGIPNSLMESIACGIPSISTDCPCGGPRLLVRNGENGMLIPVGDVNRLLLAMRQILGDKLLSEKFSYNGLKILDDYSIDKICSKWLDYIHRII